jgi:hypothetical protein
MTIDFERRLIAARDRAKTEKLAAEKQLAAERDAQQQQQEQQLRAAISGWMERIVPLIKAVVESANTHLKGSGTRLAVWETTTERRGSTGYLPGVQIFGTPEQNPGNTRSATAPYLHIAVRERGQIGILRNDEPISSPPTSIAAGNIQRHQIEAVIADFVEETI